MLTILLTKDKLTQISHQEEKMRPLLLMKPLSKIEIAAVAGGPDIDNEPPPA